MHYFRYRALDPDEIRADELRYSHVLIRFVRLPRTALVLSFCMRIVT